MMADHRMTTGVQTWKIITSAGGARLELQAMHPQPNSLDEASLRLPGGAYTTFRTFNARQALHLGDHLRRLEQTASLAGKPQALDQAGLRQAVRDVMLRAGEGSAASQDWRVRLTLDLEAQPGDIYITLQPLELLPAEAYAQGVEVVTCDLQRQLPRAKLTRFIARAGGVRQHLREGINEAVMVNPQGLLLEGLSSNFFAVKDGGLWTAGEGVLAGVTRSLALEAARRCLIPVQLHAVALADLPALEEAFITSASRGVLPVRQIDRVVVGRACPGPLTRQLMLTYQALIDEQVEDI